MQALLRSHPTALLRLVHLLRTWHAKAGALGRQLGLDVVLVAIHLIRSGELWGLAPLLVLCEDDPGERTLRKEVALTSEHGRASGVAGGGTPGGGRKCRGSWWRRLVTRIDQADAAACEELFRRALTVNSLAELEIER